MAMIFFWFPRASANAIKLNQGEPVRPHTVFGMGTANALLTPIH
jgi:hypothetical protein